MKTDQTYFLLKLAGIFLLAAVIMVSMAAFSPREFPVSTQVHIPREASLSSATDILSRKKIISSPFLFKVAVVVFQGKSGVVAGDYLFSEPQNLWTVARRLARGQQGLAPVTVTIPEGSTVENIAFIILKKIPTFSAPYFVRIAREHEGYLFPDTYRFYPNASAMDVMTTLRTTFDRRLETLATDFRLSKRKPDDLVIMASLLEREARTVTDRAIISGILWKRLDEDMPLQVDATLVYVTGRGYVTIEDTKMDSPFNTYTNKGLPPTPIANPGIDALRAAAQPVKTPYYYYLSDLNGKMYYATTHDGHLANRKKYLNK